MEKNDGNVVRIRLVFDDKLQLSQGPCRCWFLLKPDITNIGDLASQICECFDLRHRIVLSMDDFFLPSFQSTRLIKDKDIIMVKMKEAKQKDICKPCDDGKSQQNIQGNESYDKETLTSYMENAVHLDSSGGVCSTERSNKYLDSKNKEASCQMVSLSSDGGQDVASVVPLEYIHSKPREHGTLQIGGTQVDGVPIFDGILSLPKSEGMSSAIGIMKPCKHVIHFETLIPLRCLPLRGDILAYRYIESSSLVHPQLSSPQVGEVSSFDSKTLQIILLPVLDYVFLLDENQPGTTSQPNASSLYKDGTLEIEYLSLVDVRLVKAHGLKEDNDCQGDQVRKDKWEEAALKGNWNNPNASTAEQSNGWAPWIPNESVTALPCSFKRRKTPFAGRGNWAPNSSMNKRMPNKNQSNWNNDAAWNPNRRFTPAYNIAALPRQDRASGLPNPWEHHQNNTFSPYGTSFGSEKQ